MRQSSKVWLQEPVLCCDVMCWTLGIYILTQSAGVQECSYIVTLNKIIDIIEGFTGLENKDCFFYDFCHLISNDIGTTLGPL